MTLHIRHMHDAEITGSTVHDSKAQHYLRRGMLRIRSSFSLLYCSNSIASLSPEIAYGHISIIKTSVNVL
jgi:hypothetical protein